MAVGNAIVNTATFKPLTFQEWAAPLKVLNEAHKDTEKELQLLRDDADEYERYLLENPDSEVAQYYRAYIDDIEKQATLLASEGINPQIRNNLIDLRAKYNKSVKPIKQAVLRYQDIMEQRAKDSKKDYIIGAPDIDINYLLEHPEYTKNTDKESYVTSNSVYTAAKDIFKGLSAKDAQAAYDMSADGKMVKITIPRSYSANEIAKALTSGEDVPEDLLNAVNAIRTRFNYDSLGEYDKELIDHYIYQGASASAKSPYTTIRNVPKNSVVGSDGTVYPIFTDEITGREFHQTKKGFVWNDTGQPITGMVQVEGQKIDMNLGKQSKVSQKDQKLNVTTPRVTRGDASKMIPDNKVSFSQLSNEERVNITKAIKEDAKKHFGIEKFKVQEGETVIIYKYKDAQGNNKFGYVIKNPNYKSSSSTNKEANPKDFTK